MLPQLGSTSVEVHSVAEPSVNRLTTPAIPMTSMIVTVTIAAMFVTHLLVSRVITLITKLIQISPTAIATVHQNPILKSKVCRSKVANIR